MQSTSTSAAEPKIGHSKAADRESSSSGEESSDSDISWYEKDNNTVSKRETTEANANSSKAILPLQHFTIAENVIIEHIELAEGECAETDVTEDSVPNNAGQQHTKKKKSTKKPPQPSVIDKWTDLEKQKFLKAITEFGVSDMEKIAKCIPTKTLDEVTDASDYFWQHAQHRMAYSAHDITTRKFRSMKRPRREGNPLSEWLHVLNESLKVDELRTVTGDALRLIADCEYFPAPGEVTNVQFQKLYYALANAIDGRPVSELSDESYEILRRALTEVSLSTVHLRKNGFEDHLRGLTSLRSLLVGRTDEPKMCALKLRLANLIVMKPYNPLNVPLKLLDVLKMADGDLEK